MRFEQPWALLLLAAIPLLAWWRARRAGEAALLFSSTAPFEGIEPTWRARLSSLPFWLRLAALGLLILALGRPQTGVERVREPGQGIAIEMVIDHSGSMASPILYEGRQTTRLELGKLVLAEFVRGDGRELRGRGSDWVGVVAFARQPETVCPLTLSHGAIPGLVSRLRPARRINELGTAIGDAVALAAARLRQFNARSRTIVLLTDGENNAGVRNVWQAADLAARWGIRVHAIGIVGSTPNTSLPPGVQLRFASERDLAQLAKQCGGIYRSAYDGEALRSIYAEIDRLEKSEIARMRYTNGRERFAPLAAAALILLLLGEMAACAWLRRIP